MSDAICDPSLVDGATLPPGYTAERVRSAGIVAVVAGLMGIGAIMTFSAGSSADHPLVWAEFWKSASIKQLMFVGAGLLAMLVMAQIPYRVWCAGRGTFAAVLLLMAIVTLGLVFVPGIGVEVNNARRWVQIGPSSLGLRFQPSELVKAVLPLFLATWMTYRLDIREFWRGLVPVIGVIGICLGGVGIEDFGTGALIALVAAAMLLVAGARWWHLALMSLPAVPVFIYLLLSRSHRMERLMTFLDIWRDPERSGYQAIQSLCTIASGGWWGRGLGRGFVKTYLPESRTDFIFAVICEELGIIGGIAVVALLITLVWQGLAVVRRCDDPVGRLLAFGITLTLGMQAAINVAVVTVSVPTKGIALPFVSAGGSGAIFLGASVGILASIARRPSNPAAAAEKMT